MVAGEKRCKEKDEDLAQKDQQIIQKHKEIEQLEAKLLTQQKLIQDNRPELEGKLVAAQNA